MAGFGVISAFQGGLNYGIDFVGGYKVIVKLKINL
jgi:preprotein translocase subunit SecF